MDNLKYYNDSLAYDFNMFLPKVKEAPVPDDNIVKMPKRKKSAKAMQRAAAKSVSRSAASVLTAALIVAGLCGTIYLRTRVNEVNSAINTAKSELNELRSVETALEVEYGQRVAFENLEAEATALGMKKVSEEQIVYIKATDTPVAKDGNGNVIVNE